MAQDITQVNVDGILRLLNQNVRQADAALHAGLDAYNKWVSWRSQHATSADAATSLNTVSGATWITATHVDQWASSFDSFNHLYEAATGVDVGIKDCHADWDKIFN